MKKLKKAIKLIYDNLPNKYHIPIIIYPNTKEMLIDVSHEREESFEKTIKFYNNYFKDAKTNTYIRTKYYEPKKEKNDGLNTAYDISAFGGFPIWVSLKTVREHHTFKSCVFLLLHETAHQVLYNCFWDERRCDLFAIEWIKKFIKKGLI